MCLGNRTVPKRLKDRSCDKPVSLLVLEGDTEEVLYSIVQDRFLHEIRVRQTNIRGRGNVNKDVLGEIFKYAYNNRNDFVRAYCCVDTERQKRSATPFDLDFVREQVRRNKKMVRVLSIDAILADPEIESWFFCDIDGIYRFLSAKKSQRNPKRYRNPENLCKQDLQELFGRFGRVYSPGYRASNFLHNLDIDKIVSQCRVLSDGIQLIQSQADDLTNHLFAEAKF
ncbi:MAG: DUF4276 family protein [Planctomycetota bacterium]